MYSFSKQFTNCCAIWRTLFTRGESSGNDNTLRFYFRMHRPVFVLGPCTLKWALLLLYSGIIYSGFCFSFGHIWRISLRTENCWLFRSYYLAKYNSWTYALFDISTRVSPIISSKFLRIFGDMISSIECGCAVLMSHYDNSDMRSHIIWLWLWMFSSTCLITSSSDELLLWSTSCPPKTRSPRNLIPISPIWSALCLNCFINFRMSDSSVLIYPVNSKFYSSTYFHPVASHILFPHF